MELMTGMERHYKAGTIIHFESGEYSDLGTVALLVTLKDIDLDALGDQWVETLYPDPDMSGDDVDEASFIGWLCANQYCAELDHEYVHLGSYSDFDVGKDHYGVKLHDYSPTEPK